MADYVYLCAQGSQITCSYMRDLSRKCHQSAVLLSSSQV